MHHLGIGDAKVLQQGLEQPRKCRLTDLAETECGKRDAELAGGEVGIEVRAHGLEHPATQTVGSPELVRLRAAQFDDRELGGDEEAV